MKQSVLVSMVLALLSIISAAMKLIPGQYSSYLTEVMTWQGAWSWAALEIILAIGLFVSPISMQSNKLLCVIYGLGIFIALALLGWQLTVLYAMAFPVSIYLLLLKGSKN